jgi:hypothetical protein
MEPVVAVELRGPGRKVCSIWECNLQASWDELHASALQALGIENTVRYELDVILPENRRFALNRTLACPLIEQGAENLKVLVVIDVTTPTRPVSIFT